MPPPTSEETRAKRLAFVKEHLRCPHCDRDLEKWDMPQHMFSDWTAEHVYVCSHADCPYFKESLKVMCVQGTPGGACCFMYDPSREWCGPMAARTPPHPRG